jgi:hypothetical protein
VAIMITFKRDKKTGEIIAYKDGKKEGIIHEMYDDPDELNNYKKDAVLFSDEPPPIMKKMLERKRK